MLAICNGSVAVTFLCVSICIFDTDQRLRAIKLLIPFHMLWKLFKFKELFIISFFSVVLEGDSCSIYIVCKLHFS